MKTETPNETRYTHDFPSHYRKVITELERENAALRKDQERLDWLTNSLGWVIVGYPEADPSNHATEDNTLADAWRAAIDAARAKEDKP